MTSITDEFEYNSEEDEDFVPNGNASDDGVESEFEEEFDDNGNKITTKSRKSHQRKRKLTLEEKIAQGARKRATLEKINKQNKFRVGAVVLSDDEDEQINNNNNNSNIDKLPDVIMKQEENIPVVKSEPNNDKTKGINDNPPTSNNTLANDTSKNDIVSTTKIEQKSAPITNDPTTPPTMSLSQMLASYNKPKPKTTPKPKTVNNFWDPPIKSEPNTTTAASFATTTITATTLSETTNSTPSLTQQDNHNTTSNNNIPLSENIPVSISGTQVTVKELSTFAGETVEITKTFTKGSTAEKEYNANRTSKKGKDNLDFIIASLSGKRAMTTLDKTKLDWQKDKAIEGDQHELQQFTKNGYVAKQAFLAQSDAKQYETIKAMQKQAQKKTVNYAVDVD